MVICCVVNATVASFSSFATRVNSILAIILLVFLAIYPLTQQLCLYKDRHKLRNKSFRKKYGSAYENLSTMKMRYFWYPLFFFYRRLLLPLIIILMPRYFLT